MSHTSCLAAGYELAITCLIRGRRATACGAYVLGFPSMGPLSYRPEVNLNPRLHAG